MYCNGKKMMMRYLQHDIDSFDCVSHNVFHHHMTVKNEKRDITNTLSKKKIKSLVLIISRLMDAISVSPPGRFWWL